MINEGVAKNVALNVRAFRRAQGLTIGQLARCSEVSPRTIAKVESGDNVTLATLLAISEGLEISLTRLMFDGLVQRSEGTLVIRHDEVAPIDLGSRIIRRLVDDETTQVLQLEQVSMRADQSYQDAGERPGVSVRVLMLSGALRCGPASSPVDLATGDLAAFSGSRPHHYQTSALAATFLRLSCRVARDVPLG